MDFRNDEYAEIVLNAVKKIDVTAYTKPWNGNLNKHRLLAKLYFGRGQDPGLGIRSEITASRTQIVWWIGLNSPVYEKYKDKIDAISDKSWENKHPETRIYFDSIEDFLAFIDRCIGNSSISVVTQKNEKKEEKEAFQEKHQLFVSEVPLVDGVEKDMLERNTGKNNVTGIFAKNPLIGRQVLSEKTKETLFDNAKRTIDFKLTNYDDVPNEAKMQVALAAVTYAKDWDPASQSFWNYLVMRFGYKDDSVIPIIKDCVETSFQANNRLFLKIRKREYKATILIHALSTEKSWMYFYDFLFDFYKDNLNWQFDRDDPMIGFMVAVLRRKLGAGNVESEDDFEITVSNKLYYFQEGVRKLILYRPKYAEKLIYDLLENIDTIFNQVDTTFKNRYDRVLCEKWYQGKVEAIRYASERKRRHYGGGWSRNREVAIDYSHINPRILLEDDRILKISFPEIRMKPGNWESVYAEFFLGDDPVERRDLSFYGNELGRTLHEFQFDISKYVSPKDERFEIRVVLTNDEEMMYDSKDTLYRDHIIFTPDGKESEIKPDIQGYIIATCRNATLSVNGIEQEELFRDNYVLTYIFMEEEYMLGIDGNIVAMEGSAGQDFTVLYPSARRTETFIKNECEYEIVRRNSAISFIFDEDYIGTRHILYCNGKQISRDILNAYKDQNGENYTIPLADMEDDSCVEMELVSIETEKKIFDKHYYLVDRLDVGFNRAVYYSLTDYEGACVRVVCNDTATTAAIDYEDEFVDVEHGNGTLRIVIPKVKAYLNDVLITGEMDLWHGEIKQTDRIRVDFPYKVIGTVFIEDNEIADLGRGVFALGEAAKAFDSESIKKAEIRLFIDTDKGEKNYTIGRVYYKETFKVAPQFYYSDTKIMWNLGGGYFGEQDERLSLRLTVDGKNEVLPLSLEEPIVADFGEREEGEYEFQIFKKNKNLFSKEKDTVIYEGTCELGDPNKLRFKDYRIAINDVTDGVYKIKIKPCYIDHLTFEGEKEVSEGFCPVYRGILYTYDNEGRRKDYPQKCGHNKKGEATNAINPVHVIYVNDEFLCVGDTEWDGLLYRTRFNYGKDCQEHWITAVEPRPGEKGFSSIDLVHYRKERIRKDAKSN